MAKHIRSYTGYRNRVQNAVHIANTSRNIDDLSVKLDAAIKAGVLPTEEQALEALNKQRPITDPYDSGNPKAAPVGDQSKLDVRRNTSMMAYASSYSFLRQWTSASSASARNKFSNIPPYGDPSRDYFLSEIWKQEPILAGGVYSMVAKMSSMRWSVSGRKLTAKKFALILSGMAFIDGYDWGGGISGTAEDFYTTNRGSFWETPRTGDPLYGKLADLGHIDALCCTLTGSVVKPMMYSSSITGQTLYFGPGEYIHFSSIPSARETNLGAGFCAVDRALRAAKLLMGLHDYDEEKLNNLPPEGVAAVTGLTMDEFMDALALWQAERRKNASLTFPQVLWLVASQPNAKVSLDMIGFSQLPEAFDRKVVVEQYINTLALAFGIDAREFWSFTGGGGLGSAGESEIQHLKAKGKGQSEFTTIIERRLNGEAEDDAYFAFDALDIRDDADSAKVAKAVVDAYLPLYNLKPAGGGSQFGGGVIKANPQPNTNTGDSNGPSTPIPGVDTGGNMSSQAGGAKLAEQVITKDQLIRILIDKHVLPEWISSDNRVMITENDIHQRRITALKDDDGVHPDDYIRYTWENGRITPSRLPAIVLRSPSWFDDDDMIIVSSQSIEVYNPVDKMDDPSLSQVVEFLRIKEAQILGTKPNIQGKPIPETEVIRGSSVNRKTIHDELERWRKHPVLAQYAPTLDEEQILFGQFKSAPVAIQPVVEHKSITGNVGADDINMAVLKDIRDALTRMSSSMTIEIPPIQVRMPETKAPIVNVNVPEQTPPNIQVNIPEYKDSPAPVITFNPSINVAPADAPIINVNVPAAEPPTVNITTPTPVVNIDNVLNMPEEAPKTLYINRDAENKMTSVTTVPEPPENQ